jgi:hypothetical protein
VVICGWVVEVGFELELLCSAGERVVVGFVTDVLSIGCVGSAVIENPKKDTSKIAVITLTITIFSILLKCQKLLFAAGTIFILL